MPRISEAITTTVYATDEAGRVCQRCIRCGGWAPIWNPHGDTKIRIGRMTRTENPRLGQRMANGDIDTREWLVFPKCRVGHGCPACAAEFTTMKVKNPTAREPFIPVKTL